MKRRLIKFRAGNEKFSLVTEWFLHDLSFQVFSPMGISKLCSSLIDNYLGKNKVKLEILNSADPAQHRKWIEIWESWAGHEIYAHPNYVNLYIKDSEESIALYLKTNAGGVLFPLIKRNLSLEEWVGCKVDFYDVISPYGYGGAFGWGDGLNFQTEFWEMYQQWCLQNKVVSTFVRLSLFSEQVLMPLDETESPYGNIVRSLNLEADEIFYDYKHAVRKNIKRAIKSGLSVAVDDDGFLLEDFLRIYYSTMERVDASIGYYFPKTFFENIMASLPESFVFFHVLHEGTVISSELVLVSDCNIYSFLGGADPEYSNMRPNNFLKHEIIKWGKEHGKINFVLGGGYHKDDGIFRYKQQMAPNGELPFYTFKSIHCDSAYDQLILMRKSWETSQGREWQAAAGFFPSYRS